MKKILIASPVKQKDNILNEFLISLNEVDKTDLDVYYYFVDDNTDQKSSDLLKKFSKKNKNVILKSSKDFNVLANQEYVCNNNTHLWKKALIERITTYKNDMIKMAQDNKFDYLFFIDSDIVLHPQTIQHLISRNVDIVSNVFWTIWKAGGTLSPQVWLQDENANYIKDWDVKYNEEQIRQKQQNFINMLKIPGIYRVGGLGACTLISKKAINSPISFSMIDNLSFWGEDRHFCIRARALGLNLYVDTVYPAYHIYREEYLSGVSDFKKNGFNPNQYKSNPLSKSRIKNILNRNKENREDKLSLVKRKIKKLERVLFTKKRIINNSHSLTVSMIVHNESGRYLKRVLEAAKKYADSFVIIDDASTDDTVKVCKDVLKDKKLTIIENKVSMFANEYKLRKLQWEQTIKENPDWILFLDADEEFESSINEKIKYLMDNNDVDAYCFRLFDMWNENQYREDELWRNDTYRPFMVRYQPKFHYRFRKTNQHCGRMPANVLRLNYVESDIRVKHYGWMSETDRKEKYERYKKLDPEGKFGNKEQYESILDKNPNLVDFEDKNEN